MKTLCPTLSFASALLQVSLFFSTNALKFKTSEFLANFDDVSSSIPQPVSLYAGLYWSQFEQYRPFSNESDVHGVATSSPPFHALSIPSTHGPGGIPAIHTGFGLTGVSFFDLQSFSWACLVLTADAHTPLQPETPANCTLSIQCFDPARSTADVEMQNAHSGPLPEPKISVVYFFTVSTAMKIWGVHMAKVVLGGAFHACQTITLDVRAMSGEGVQQVALALDDVRYRTYRVTAWDMGVGEVVHENGPYGTA